MRWHHHHHRSRLRDTVALGSHQNLSDRDTPFIFWRPLRYRLGDPRWETPRELWGRWYGDIFECPAPHGSSFGYLLGPSIVTDYLSPPRRLSDERCSLRRGDDPLAVGEQHTDRYPGVAPAALEDRCSLPVWVLVPQRRGRDNTRQKNNVRERFYQFSKREPEEQMIAGRERGSSTRNRPQRISKRPSRTSSRRWAPRPR